MSTNPAVSNGKPVVPYVAVPQVIYEALRDGLITHAMFDVFQYCYFKANRADSYQVEAYSASAVCKFFGLTPNPANRKHFERAVADLWERNLIAHDYHRLYPQENKPHSDTRTHSVWIIPPQEFTAIGSREANFELWPQHLQRCLPPVTPKPWMSHTSVARNVAMPAPTSIEGAVGYGEEEGNGVAGDVALNTDIYSIKHQCKSCSNAAQAYIPSADAAGNIDDSSATPPLVPSAQPADDPAGAGLDDRWGKSTPTPKAVSDIQQRAEEFGTYVWDATQLQPPSSKAVRALVKRFSREELTNAFDECIAGKKGKTLISSVRLFFDNGAANIVASQMKRIARLVEVFKETFTSTTRKADLRKAATATGVHVSDYDGSLGDVFERALDLWLADFSDDDQNAILSQLYRHEVKEAAN